MQGCEGRTDGSALRIPWYVHQISRREFVGALCASAAAAGGLAAACAGESSVAPSQSYGEIVGDVVDLGGVPQASLGKIFLMFQTGQQTGRTADVDPAGRFIFKDVAPGRWQLRFHAPGVAYVPEELPHPVPVQVSENQVASVRITIERGWEDGVPMIEVYVGDYFFQEQPFGHENGETIVKIGTPVCWYNVGQGPHTVTGPFWDSGTMERTASYIWVPDRTGVFPYTCNFHKTQMIASLRVQS
jgi:plastocyanin